MKLLLLGIGRVEVSLAAGLSAISIDRVPTLSRWRQRHTSHHPPSQQSPELHLPSPRFHSVNRVSSEINIPRQFSPSFRAVSTFLDQFETLRLARNVPSRSSFAQFLTMEALPIYSSEEEHEMILGGSLLELPKYLESRQALEFLGIVSRHVCAFGSFGEFFILCNVIWRPI